MVGGLTPKQSHLAILLGLIFAAYLVAIVYIFVALSRARSKRDANHTPAGADVESVIPAISENEVYHDGEYGPPSGFEIPWETEPPSLVDLQF